MTDLFDHAYGESVVGVEADTYLATAVPRTTPDDVAVDLERRLSDRDSDLDPGSRFWTGAGSEAQAAYRHILQGAQTRVVV